MHCFFIFLLYFFSLNFQFRVIFVKKNYEYKTLNYSVASPDDRVAEFGDFFFCKITLNSATCYAFSLRQFNLYLN